MKDILDEFITDMNDIIGLLSIFDTLELRKQSIDLKNNKVELNKPENAIYKLSFENSQGTKKAPGLFVPYVAGRFEIFIRTIFEETSTHVAKTYNEFVKLPEVFRKSLIEDTSKVIAAPRKYQHGEGARNTFIKNLHDNIHTNNLSTINYQCISITDQNIKFDVVQKLFRKINYSGIWNDVSAQANIRAYFEGVDANQARNNCQSKLDTFMDNRNSIAHPSNEVTWMSSVELLDYITFLKEIATAITQVCPMYVAKFKKNKSS